MLSLPSSGWGRALVLAAMLHSSVVLADDAVATLSVDDAVSHALSRHPSLRSAEATLRTAQGARGDAAFLNKNPTVSAWASTDLERANLQLLQPVSLTAQGAFTRSASSHRVDSATASLERTEREVAASTRLAYVQAAVATKQVEVAEEGAALAERLAFAVTRKHEEGEASLLDLRLARLAQVQASVRLAEARKAQSSALRVLASWTLEALTPGTVLTEALTAAPEATSAPQERADLTAARQRLLAAEQQLKVQQAATLPAVSIGANVSIEDGQTWVGPSVSATLPVFNRNQTGRGAAAAQISVAESQVASLEAVIATEQSTAAHRVRETDALLEATSPATTNDAHLALKSIEAGVLAGELDLPTALLLQSQVLDGEMAILQLGGLVATARIDLLLASDDNALLGAAR